VLVIGAAHARSEVAAIVGASATAHAIGYDELAQRGRLVDAAAAFAILEAESGALILESLTRLRDLPAGKRLVLLTGKISEELLASALERLMPRAWLPHPTPAVAVAHALRGLALETPSAIASRSQQRPAEALLGVSRALRDVLDRVSRVAPTGMPVLILGETGTGKELVARAVHAQSGRSRKPFVAVNCGALPDSLLEAELFGHRRGAFTGAERDRVGLFEQAAGGTLFLDEIGDTSPALQAKLLRALEEKEIRPLGGSEVVRVEARVVCATHRDLDAMVEGGSFRRDLLYRINAATLQLPPLRRRRVDIPFLAQHFAEEFGEQNARRILLDESFIDALSEAELPGNVRELRNLIERSIALAAPGEALSARHLAAAAGPQRSEIEDRSAAPARPALVVRLQDEVEALERRLLRDALRRCGGNRSHAAAQLGLSRQGLRNRMQRYGID
jgi:transcriptional regulator with GAF, ATPase, and Fis domain